MTEEKKEARRRRFPKYCIILKNEKGEVVTYNGDVKNVDFLNVIFSSPVEVVSISKNN